MTISLRTTAALALAFTAVAACKKKPVPAPAPAPLAEAPRINQDSIDAARRAEEERARAAAEAAERARLAGAVAAARNTLTATIYFNYDESELTAEARQTLDAKLPLLKANAGMRIRIAGHTDSRGSDEYNLALGQRRAAAAKRYLAQMGIEESRMDVVSFGRERPAMQGEDEGAWSKNRRDEFEIIVGGDNIRLP